MFQRNTTAVALGGHTVPLFVVVRGGFIPCQNPAGTVQHGAVVGHQGGQFKLGRLVGVPVPALHSPTAYTPRADRRCFFGPSSATPVGKPKAARG